MVSDAVAAEDGLELHYEDQSRDNEPLPFAAAELGSVEELAPSTLMLAITVPG